MSLTPPFFPKSPSPRLSARVAIQPVRHGPQRSSVVAPSLGEGFQDRVPQQPGGGCFPGVLEEVSRRRRGTIPLVAWVAEGMVAELADGRHTGAFQVGISIENPRGQRAACCCRETHCPVDLDLGALVYRFGGLDPLSNHCSLLPDAAEDGASRPPHGAPPPLGC